jgi:hypothetical protein
VGAPEQDVADQTTSEQRLLCALAWMCEQYLKDGQNGLDHMSMSAGECAVVLLIEYGLVEPRARGGVWTEAGLAMLDSN